MILPAVLIFPARRPELGEYRLSDMIDPGYRIFPSLDGVKARGVSRLLRINPEQTHR